ncbi:hypothetical protein OPV22_025866 [Ensete ventricosum]|uniref:Uncharacterized protein n=1 Tax=Ensete ventricosum TaxID=4639 RepID=A0AAV8QDU6_ENSVE|nr:hypothetical protein OPV22_025866 [Ensete ventricosum]
MLNGTTFHRALRRTGTGRPTHGPSEVEVDPEKVVGGEAVGGSAWFYERACSRWPRQALPDMASGAEVETAVAEGEVVGEVEVDRNRVLAVRWRPRAALVIGHAHGSNN